MPFRAATTNVKMELMKERDRENQERRERPCQIEMLLQIVNVSHLLPNSVNVGTCCRELCGSGTCSSDKSVSATLHSSVYILMIVGHNYRCAATIYRCNVSL